MSRCPAGMGLGVIGSSLGYPNTLLLTENLNTAAKFKNATSGQSGVMLRPEIVTMEEDEERRQYEGEL